MYDILSIDKECKHCKSGVPHVCYDQVKNDIRPFVEEIVNEILSKNNGKLEVALEALKVAQKEFARDHCGIGVVDAAIKLLSQKDA